MVQFKELNRDSSLIHPNPMFQALYEFTERVRFDNIGSVQRTEPG